MARCPLCSPPRGLRSGAAEGRFAGGAGGAGLARSSRAWRGPPSRGACVRRGASPAAGRRGFQSRRRCFCRAAERGGGGVLAHIPSARPLENGAPPRAARKAGEPKRPPSRAEAPPAKRSSPSERRRKRVGEAVPCPPHKLPMGFGTPLWRGRGGSEKRPPAIRSL
ncbi:small nuclear ribonucleoprotein-associated protein B'-like [Candoia aspera]|uniref:small nuclear ribonucleoprotein-associated protein B'-like n=1 Tax=Candoia aspera TaxID=51853 RepID=UPI002FD7BA2C